MVEVRTIAAGAYDVHVGAGNRVSFAGQIATAAPGHHYAIVSDANVAPRYAGELEANLRANYNVSLHVIPPGESFKSRTEWARITDEILGTGAGRDTVIVALGGGVVGDLAGFVAATYMRGVPVVQCPTSLLAMIDASVGGKTGVDTAHGKNLVGAFHPPAVVLVDTDVLSTLPLAHRRAGMAEAIKHGVICDAAYFTHVTRSAGALLAARSEEAAHIVARSVEIKAGVVRDDPFEHGRRKILNFGHTLGHAIEQASEYRLLHGECVAIGMALEARLAERIGIAAAGTANAIRDCLVGVGLPVTVPSSLRADAIIALTRSDKKARGGAATYALPKAIGEMEPADGSWSVAVEDRAVHELLR